MPPPSTPLSTDWPPDYVAVTAWRRAQEARFELDEKLVIHAKTFYKSKPAAFINHWCTTFDPRNAAVGKPTRFPFIMFKRQEELVEFVMACLDGQATGLVEKSRDMGATWLCCALTVWLWLFGDSVAIGWGSRKKEQLDRLGDPSTIFEKLRILILNLPKQLLPVGLNERDHLTFMRCVNPENGSTIIGEIGDDIGRGARTLIYFVDEAAHLDHPEKVEASLLDTTRTRIDISSVSGLGSIFHRKREAGKDWVRGQKCDRTHTNIFVMDWRDHPDKTEEWYNREKKRLTEYGMAHVFAREVDRDYAASVEGIIIPAEWVRAAIDADKKLGLDDSGANVAGLDVADEGGDRNALARRKGVILKSVDEWGNRDTGYTARHAVTLCRPMLPCDLQYDAIGVGAGIKAESNRLQEEGLLPKDLHFIPWNAGAAVIDPFGHVIEDDKQSPLNRDFYGNLKAQAWWSLRRRFEKTFRAVTEPGFTFSYDELISIPGSLPLLRQLEKELSQATIARSSRMKLIVNKAPEGTRSPNLADAVVMAFFPMAAIRKQRVSLVAPIIIRS